VKATAQQLTLAGALALAVAWLVWPAPERAQSITLPAEDAGPSVWQEWGLEPVDWPGAVDGRGWEPIEFLDTATALGVDDDRRLVYIESDADPVVLAEPAGLPGVVATAATGDRLAWLSSTPDANGQVVTELWTAERDGEGRPGEPVLVTGDTGDVVIGRSAYDLQFASESLHWLATARSSERVTERRSVPVGGGEVEVVGHVGAWQATAWPWLASAGSDGLGGAQLVRTDTGTGVLLPAADDELAICSATWCRLLVITSDGSRIDLLRPDGSDRRTIATGFASPVSADVGLVDRFEPLEESTATSGDRWRLTLADLETGGSYLVASQSGGAGASGRYLWWSTGSDELLTWHVLDLTDLG
jgi:hypothetical protein